MKIDVRLVFLQHRSTSLYSLCRHLSNQKKKTNTKYQIRGNKGMNLITSCRFRSQLGFFFFFLSQNVYYYINNNCRESTEKHDRGCRNSTKIHRSVPKGCRNKTKNTTQKQKASQRMQEPNKKQDQL